MTMVRGRLISVIYQQTLEANVESVDDPVPVTLMSADVERISQIIRTSS